jgi:hypothetical protein
LTVLKYWILHAAIHLFVYSSFRSWGAYCFNLVLPVNPVITSWPWG